MSESADELFDTPKAILPALSDLASTRPRKVVDTVEGPRWKK
jgi:hypothetical protein